MCNASSATTRNVHAIIFGTRVHKAREKLLQMAKHLTLRDCLKICHHYESLQYHLNVVKPTDKPVESITKHCFNRGRKQQQPLAKKTGTFRSQPSIISDQQILLIKQSHVVTVVQLIPKTDALLIDQLSSIVTEWVIIHLCADLLIAVPVLIKTQGNSTDFMVEVDHSEVEDLLQEDRSMMQLRSLKPSLMTNLTYTLSD